MSNQRDELIQKKLEQIGAFIAELHTWTARPFAEFVANTALVRASERNFQLMVEIASDINAKILIAKTKKAPDTYRDSFMKKITRCFFALSKKCCHGTRNILDESRQRKRKGWGRIFNNKKAFLFGAYVPLQA